MPVEQTNRSHPALAWETLLDLRGAGSLVEQLERALRGAVDSGRLPTGAALPASRALADALGVSRWVVTQVYEQLVAEGVLEARIGSGTRVAMAGTGTPALPRQPSPSDAVPSLPVQPGHDLRPGFPDLRHVPRDAWARAVRDGLAQALNNDLATAPAAGHPAARVAVAAHLRRARLVDAPDSAVVITRGATDAMGRVAAALRASGHTHLLVEDPSWPVLRDVAARAGLTPVAVPVDEHGVDVEALATTGERTGARAVLLTPAHQFPTGVPLTGERRDSVLAWAGEVDGLVIEDDYDAEFRYDRRPVAALQRLDPSRVVLIGSTSKTMTPALGLGWMIVPAGWRVPLTPEPGMAPPVVDQLALTSFMSSGGYDRHLRAARKRYRRRHDALAAALVEQLPHARVSGLAAGLHLVLDLGPDAPDAADVVRAAAALDVGVVDMRRYENRPSSFSRLLVIGYGNLADARLHDAVARLASAAS